MSSEKVSPQRKRTQKRHNRQNTCNRTEWSNTMGKLGKKNKDSKEAANKKIAQQLAALKRKQAAKKK